MDSLQRHAYWLVSFAFALLIVGSYHSLFTAPTDFPKESIVSIVRGASAPAVAKQLEAAHIIKHPSVLQLVLRVWGKSDRIQAGRYLFNTPENIFTIASRLVAGAYGFPPVRITFPEGITVREIAADLAATLPGVSAADFSTAAKQYEGYLFPDTYLFLPSADTASIIATLRDNFDTRIATLESAIQASGRSLSDTVILASIVEKEARTDVNRRIVAGVLLNRLKIGMPLQVDAVFGYIFNRDTYSPSFADLKVDSPYNTYTHRGLPPGPINNPGLAAIDAVVHPTKTAYLYYFTDKNGVMHYSTTYAAHLLTLTKFPSVK